MMKTIKGNLITLANEGKFDLIVHGCNCFNTMGAGIAKSIKQAYPEAWEVDRNTIKGGQYKLGGVTTATTKSGLIVVNAYTQYRYNRTNGVAPVNYDAIRDCFGIIADEYSDKRIGYPAIGAGLAGGDWNIISKIINEELEGLDHTFVEYG